ncbi:MAG: recombination mediator RecR [Candidatus Cloacimonadota bacterium]|nr:recombination mediator RecR [Candidatus Cloacimonadota bacterium]
MKIEEHLENLKNSFKKLPGIGSKTAERLAFHLISGKKQEAIDLARTITDSINSIRKCDVCNMLSAHSPCQFCSSTERQNDLLCVVERTQDVYLLEKINNFKGRYFVLGHLISPLDGIGPKEIDFPHLESLVKERNVSELILAINPSSEGESTMSFISSKLENDNLKITRLATGLPVGGNIEFTTLKTLQNAFNHRQKI